MKENPIVIFDGVCNYCNGLVNFAIKRDPKAVLRFCPSQSDTGTRLLSDAGLSLTPDSAVLVDDGKIYTNSTSVVRIAKYLKWPYKALYGLILIPRPIRDALYMWFARRRYKFFGKKDTCMIPTSEVRSRFIL